MKKMIGLVTILLLLLAVQGWGYGIVNNSGTSSEDSVAVNVLCPDSLGRPTKCDSFYVVIFKSGTNAVVFRDSGLIGMTGMDSTIIGGRTAYYYHRATADIDGDGLAGQYSGQVVSVTVTADIPFISPFTFQVVSLELDDQLSEIAHILDTLQVYDAAGHLLADVQAILDTLQVYDAAGHLLANIQAILDSIKLYDTAERFTVDVTKISGDATAANNAELFFDGTGYAGTNNVIPSVTTTTNLTTNNDKTGYALSNAGNSAVAGSTWGKAKSDHTAGNTFGGDALDNDMWTDAKAGYLDATISSRSTLTAANVWETNISAYSGGGYAGTYLKTLFDEKGNWLTATGFLTSAGFHDSLNDYWMKRLAHENYDTMLAHADDFKFGGSDSVRAYLSTHDSTLLEQAASCLGSGSDTLHVLALVGGTPYAGAMITVKDASDNKLYWNYTNSSGFWTFNVDPATYHIYPSGGRINWDSTYITSVVPSGGLIDTVTGTAFAPSAPGDANSCSLYTWVTDGGGSNEIGGTLKWGFMSRQYRIQTTAGKYVSREVRSATSDKDGYVGEQVYWSSVLQAQDANGDAVDTVRIWVEFKPQGSTTQTFRTENWVVPDSTTYDLKNLFSY